jgi:hypothetical protein
MSVRSPGSVGYGGLVILAVGVLDVCQQLGPFACEIGAASEPVAGSAHRHGIDGRWRAHPAAEAHRDRVGVDRVIVGCAPRDWLA